MWRRFKSLANDMSLVLVCGGNSSRFGDENKLFKILLDKTVVEWSIEAFYPFVDRIIIVCGKNDILFWNDIINSNQYAKIKHVIVGGATRQESVRKGLCEVITRFVAIHDGARPLVLGEDIESVFEYAHKDNAACLASPIFGTLNRCDDRFFISENVDRNNIWEMQTPQVFLSENIKAAHQKAEDDNFSATDDATLYNKYIGNVRLIQSHFPNTKITTPSDFELCEKLAIVLD